MRLDLKQVCGGAFEHPSLRSGHRARKSHVALRHGVSPSLKAVERMDFAEPMNGVKVPRRCTARQILPSHTLLQLWRL